MAVALPSLDDTTWLLADGGASLNARDHTGDAVRLALRLGATGVLFNVWPTAAGDLVVARTEGRGRRRVTKLRDGTTATATVLGDVLEAAPAGTLLGIGVRDDAAFEAVAAAVTAAGRDADVWYRNADLERLTAWRRQCPEANFVLPLARAPRAGGLEREVAGMRGAGVGALEMRASEWTGGHVALAHRFGRYAWATDADYPHVIEELLTGGLDAVAGRNIEYLVDTAAGIRP